MKNLHDIENEISIWDKWGYDWIENQIVCFTLHDAFEDGTAIYKKKQWFDCSFTDLYKIIRQRKFRKTFTLHTNTFIGKTTLFEEELETHV